jgi:UDP-N-acetylmuramoylalanine--D-glutamate ligase
VAGNVGTPLASLVGGLDPEAVVVCECSSFQLEDSLDFRPEVAVLLNLEPDHLNRHGTMEAYTAAKLRIFANQGDGDVALRPEDFGSIAVDPAGLRLSGVPNLLEEVAEIGGVAYVNDSKATNGASARRGLEAFEAGTVHAILGGSLKGSDFTELRGPLAHSGVAAYLIGEAEGELAKDLDGVVPIHRCGDLATAATQASAAAAPGQVVLLSPACASYDQYPDYEARGEHFRELVRALEK